MNTLSPSAIAKRTFHGVLLLLVLLSLPLLLLLTLSPQLSSAAAVVTISKAAHDRFRTKSHLQPVTNWMNDPCGPTYDKVTDTYHLFYQHNPHGSSWGHMSWGHATSKDLVYWKHESVALTPSVSTPDGRSHFVHSGSAVAQGAQGLFSIFYTGSFSGASWTNPYVRGSEKIMLATSSDHGITFQKRGVLLSEPPQGADFRAWRDPIVFQSSEINRLYGDAGRNDSFMAVSGNIHGQGGLLHLYKSVDYVRWDYLGIFMKAPRSELTRELATLKPSGWQGTWGGNLELGSFFTRVDEDGHKHHFIIASTEGGRTSHGGHWTLWISGDLIMGDNNQPKFKITNVGVADAGSVYGPNTFHDTKFDRQIMFAWITEDFKRGPWASGAGWSGVMTFPREMFVSTIRNVYDPKNRWRSLGPFKVTEEPSGTKVIKTWGVRPVVDVSKIRSKIFYQYRRNRTQSPALRAGQTLRQLLPLRSKSFELQLNTSSIPSKGGKIGVVVRHPTSPPSTTTATKGQKNQPPPPPIAGTHIYYDHRRGCIEIDRTHSTTDPTVNRLTESAKFKLFRQIRNPNPKSNTKTNSKTETEPVVTLEPLRLRIFVDNSVVEVYVNDRVVLTTRIYPDGGVDDDAAGIYVVADGAGAAVDALDVWAFQDKGVIVEKLEGEGEGDGAGSREVDAVVVEEKVVSLETTVLHVEASALQEGRMDSEASARIRGFAGPVSALLAAVLTVAAVHLA